MTEKATESHLIEMVVVAMVVIVLVMTDGDDGGGGAPSMAVVGIIPSVFHWKINLASEGSLLLSQAAHTS